MSKVLNAIYKHLTKKIALGNSDRAFKHVASDLLNATPQSIETIADGTYLSEATIKKVMLLEEPYSPHSDTLERVFRYCNAQVLFHPVRTKEAFHNKKKEVR